MDTEILHLDLEAERRLNIRRILVLVVVGASLYAGSRLLGWFVLRPFLGFIDPEFVAELASMIGFFILLGALGFLLNLYLKYGPAYFRAPSSIEVDVRNNELNLIRHLEQRVTAIEADSNRVLQAELISDEEKKKYLDEAVAALTGAATEEFLSKLSHELEANAEREEVKRLAEKYGQIVSRLNGQVEQLARRGNLNLVFGILATLSGFLIFWYMIPDATKAFDSLAIVSGQFIPRLSLVILIEIFAYFFLGLYRASLSEIKYFQNEITNIEAKIIALDYASVKGDADALRSILDKLGSTERNHLLKKGESTIGLEHEKLAQAQNATLLNMLDSLIKREKQG